MYLMVRFTILFAILITGGLSAQANVVINEILADVPTDGECLAFGEPVGAIFCGDTNRDYSVDAEDDQFVELVNASGTDAADISGWTLSDSTGVRHTFPSGTILQPGTAIVVFGGGTPTGLFGGALIQTASTGTLALNADNDLVRLSNADSTEIDVRILTAGTADGGESVVRAPDVTGTTLVKHFSNGSGAQRIASPGVRTDETYFHGICAVSLPVLDQAQLRLGHALSD
jgi:hypothetical protein